MERRPATAEEARALAHPLRLRVLRLCLDRSLTNRQLADELQRDPGTVHHHVHVLLDTGFLEAEPVRKGASGALEKPYRSTGKSWEISVGTAVEGSEEGVGPFASLEAFREEVHEAGPDSLLEATRLGLRLREEDAERLRLRVLEVLEEFAEYRDAEGEDHGVYFALHRMAAPPGDR